MTGRRHLKIDHARRSTLAGLPPQLPVHPLAQVGIARAGRVEVGGALQRIVKLQRAKKHLLLPWRRSGTFAGHPLSCMPTANRWQSSRAAGQRRRGTPSTLIRRARPDHVAASGDPAPALLLRPLAAVAAIVHAIFADGIERERAVAIRPVAQGLAVHPIVRHRIEKLGARAPRESQEDRRNAARAA